jgi:ATP-dependent Clp protease adaptor protein ClpS
MPIFEPDVLPEGTEAETIVRPRATPRERTRTKRQPPYAVVLHNDDINGFDYVMGVLRRVFGYGGLKAFRLTLAAHVGGRSTIWSGSLEVAELKADQVRSCGPDPEMKSHGALPLRVSIEPLDAG